MNKKPISAPEILTVITLPNIQASRDFAARLAPLLKVGDVVALDGALGAGKTEICRAIIRGLGYPAEVPSPTFSLVQTYEVPGADYAVWHMDMYRLEEPEEAYELGLEEAFDEGISLIEWPSRLGNLLPPEFLTIRLDIRDKSRKLTLMGNKVWQDRLGSIIPHD